MVLINAIVIKTAHASKEFVAKILDLFCAQRSILSV